MVQRRVGVAGTGVGLGVMGGRMARVGRASEGARVRIWRGEEPALKMSDDPAGLVGRLLNSTRLTAAMAMERQGAWRERRRVEEARDRRVRSIVGYAYRRVPYYQETLRRLGLQPGDIRTAADLCRLPFIDPKEVHQDLERFTAQGVDRGDWLALDSSGSTGTSRVVYVDGASLLRNTAHGVRDRQVVPGAVAWGSGYREVCIGSYASSNARVQGYIARQTWVPARARLKRLLLGMEVDPAESLRRAIEYEARVVFASGSYVNDMAAALSRSGARQLPFGFAVASEGVTRETRDFLVEKCGSRVVSIYGAVEALKIGFSCERWTGIHVNEDLYPLRVVDADGCDCGPGERGEVIVSNLMNRATVLLNYRLRDVAQWMGSPCGCGRTLPLLSFPRGGCATGYG